MPQCLAWRDLVIQCAGRLLLPVVRSDCGDQRRRDANENDKDLGCGAGFSSLSTYGKIAACRGVCILRIKVFSDMSRVCSSCAGARTHLHRPHASWQLTHAPKRMGQLLGRKHPIHSSIVRTVDLISFRQNSYSVYRI